MDAAFVTEATDFMKKELKKQNPDMKKVEDSMLRTTAARRKSIELDGMSLTDVVGLYPALTLEKEKRRQYHLAADWTLQDVQKSGEQSTLRHL
ncbi:hypothetical protein HPB52_020166 [Rhipicephalus sanguineus]|uniref:Uncharacterized protein n=1 Tax=Rhipicephalus sanguineus TaxID=34632 RepID=A0A9D4SR99_RHISA|nr:hypothetical protein HPB52_020166 [Rhipicephalus sanguineus]